MSVTARNPAGARIVLLASLRSFCAGVERAITVVEQLLDHQDGPICVRKQIVHNTHVVADLQARGAVFVDELDAVPDGATVVFSALGVSPAVRSEANTRGLEVIDATCPLGITADEVAELHVADPARVSYLTQTTLAVDETTEIVEALRTRFPALRGPASDDICYATTNPALHGAAVVSLLGRITGPADLIGMSTATLAALTEEIRAFLIDKVSNAGGHLGSTLGTVELTIAAHRVFDSPRDVLLFDTGYQAYVHKVLTGRCAEFDSLRQAGGLSDYPSRAESVPDVIENSHASTALSYADGLAKAFAVRGESHRRGVAIVGDGALTGGMCSTATPRLSTPQPGPRCSPRRSPRSALNATMWCA